MTTLLSVPVVRRHKSSSGVQTASTFRLPFCLWCAETRSDSRRTLVFGLVFANAGEPYLYVYDKKTGKEITRLATPYRRSGTPMTYVARSGKQFVIVAAGAGPDAALVAFAFP
jgi:hypothetical protein